MVFILIAATGVRRTPPVRDGHLRGVGDAARAVARFPDGPRPDSRRGPGMLEREYANEYDLSRWMAAARTFAAVLRNLEVPGETDRYV
ncbi:MAG: hypothetical protein ABFC89_10595 [Methanospirillum sp.]